MQIRISTELVPPWDDSDDSFLTDHSQDDDSISESTIQPISTEEPPEPMPTINPYQRAEPTPLRTTIANTLRAWLLPRQPAELRVEGQQPQIPAAIAIQTESPIPPETHQTTIQRSRHNQPWGDSISLPKSLTTLRVVSRNVNSLSPQQDYVQWKAAASALQNIEADVIALQETNLAWNKAHRRRIRQIFHQVASAAVISTANSAEINTDNHQRGGTMQAIVGNWTPRTVSTGTDESGLGRWSFIEVQGQSDQRFIFLSGYRVCENQQVDFGSQNTYNQQYRLLHQQGHSTPDPSHSFLMT